MRPTTVAQCSLAVVGLAFAQGDRGTITGRVADPAGPVVAGAAVEAKHVENFTGSSMAASAARYGRGLHPFPEPLLR